MAGHPCLVHSEIVHPMSGHFKSTEIVRHPCLLIWGVWPFRYTGTRDQTSLQHWTLFNLMQNQPNKTLFQCLKGTTLPVALTTDVSACCHFSDIIFEAQRRKIAEAKVVRNSPTGWGLKVPGLRIFTLRLA